MHHGEFSSIAPHAFEQIKASACEGISECRVDSGQNIGIEHVSEVKADFIVEAARLLCCTVACPGT